jgi:peptidoglycan/xylan/chitin deacetylase (PgdA/CDA1 family)
MAFSTLTKDLVVLAAVAAVSETLASAALRPHSQLFGRTLIAGNDPREVALTFDDGPNDRSTPPLLELLARHNVRATFFMIGKYIRQRPDLVREVHAAGHLVGNHTMTHPWLSWQSARVVREEMGGCNKLLEDTLGAPVHYFRPPHGARRPMVIRYATELGMKTVQWNAMGHDWDPIGVDRIVASIQKDMKRNRKRGRGSNILLHDGGDRAMGIDRSDAITSTARLLELFTRECLSPVTVDAWG